MTTTTLRNRSALRHTTVSGAFANLWTNIGQWRERARQRRHLAEMSPEMLKDIGLSAAAARAEAGKPFWII